MSSDINWLAERKNISIIIIIQYISSNGQFVHFSFDLLYNNNYNHFPLYFLCIRH